MEMDEEPKFARTRAFSRPPMPTQTPNFFNETTDSSTINTVQNAEQGEDQQNSTLNNSDKEDDHQDSTANNSDDNSSESESDDDDGCFVRGANRQQSASTVMTRRPQMPPPTSSFRTSTPNRQEPASNVMTRRPQIPPTSTPNRQQSGSNVMTRRPQIPPTTTPNRQHSASTVMPRRSPIPTFVEEQNSASGQCHFIKYNKEETPLTELLFNHFDHRFSIARCDDGVQITFARDDGEPLFRHWATDRGISFTATTNRIKYLANNTLPGMTKQQAIIVVTFDCLQAGEAFKRIYKYGTDNEEEADEN